MLHNLFCIFVAATWVSVLMPFVLVAMLVTWDTSTSIWVARRIWSPVLLWAAGAKLVVSGLEHVDAKRPTIYVCNHQSTIDIPVLFVALPVNLRFIAKRQIQWLPVIGWYMKLAKFVFVDRASTGKAVASLDRAARLIRSGVSIIVFAEGTRSPEGHILPFKKGPFVLARKAGVAICPVAIEGSGRLMPKNSWNITPGEIHVKVGAPVDASAFADKRAEELLRAVRARIIEQSLALGGKGGDDDKAIAARGFEGVAQQS